MDKTQIEVKKKGNLHTPIMPQLNNFSAMVIVPNYSIKDINFPASVQQSGSCTSQKQTPQPSQLSESLGDSFSDEFEQLINSGASTASNGSVLQKTTSGASVSNFSDSTRSSLMSSCSSPSLAQPTQSYFHPIRYVTIFGSLLTPI